MKSERLQRIIPYFVFLGLPILLAVSLFVSNLRFFTDTCDRFGDYPLIALDTARAARWEALVGPYSRHGFNHPGPFNLYWNARISSLFGFIQSEYGRYSSAQLLLTTILLSAITHALYRFVGVRGSLLGFAAAVYILVSSSEISFLADIWGPASLPCATLAFIVCSAAIAAGALCYTLPWTLASSILLSNHLGTWPIIIPTAVVVLIIALLRYKNRHKVVSRVEVASLLASFVVFIAAAAPPVYEAITSPNLGNLGKIIFFTGSRTGSQSLGDVLPYIESFFDLMLGETRIQGRFIAPFLILCAISAYRGNPRFFALFLLLIVALSLLTIPSALHIRGGLHPFICWHLYGVAAALYGVAAIGCASWLERQHWGRTLLTNSVAPLCCALLAIVVTTRYTPNNSCVSTGVYENAVTKLALRGDTLYVLETREGHVPWQHYAQIAYALSRHDISFCVAQRWEFMYGFDRSCRRLMRDRGTEAPIRTLRLVSKSFPSPQPTIGVFDAGPFLVVERPYDKERLSD